jgi:hypothetical protein
MAIPEVAGLIEAKMTISQAADGRISFRVLIGADSDRSSECDLVELIISPEHVSRALAVAEIRALAGTKDGRDESTFPCHIGLYSNAGHTAV